MHTDDNIFKGLKEFEAPPPVDLFTSIVNKINDEVHAIDATLKLLTDYAQEPDEDLYHKIFQTLFGVKKEVAKIVPFFTLKKLAGVAAVAMLIVGLWQIAKRTLETKEDPAANVAQSPKVQDQPTTTFPAPTDLVKADTKIKVGRPIPKKSFGSTLQKNERRVQEESSTIVVDQMVFTIKNNDLFTTFASFNPNNLPGFLLSITAKSVNIRVDRSTSINLSENMVKMMQTLYKTKSNGKPTNKAKRTKRKFDKWKEADEHYFDDKVQMNPMDPVDLGEFLF